MFTATDIALVLGTVLSLLGSYLPKFSDWYMNLDGTYKRLFMLGGGVVIVGGAFGLSCANVVVYFACSWVGGFEALKLFAAFMIANQTTYLLSPRKL
jgi:hypothetical protein